MKINLVIDCANKEGDEVYVYDWKTGKSIPEDLPIQLSCYALYGINKWQVPPEIIKVIEFNLFFNKSSWFSVSLGDVENTKGYIRGSIKDMRSLLLDVEKNIPMVEDRFSKVEDERVSLRCNFRKVCRV